MDVQTSSLRRSRYRDLALAAGLAFACLLGAFQTSSSIALDVVLLLCAFAAPFTRWRWPLLTVAAITAALAICAFRPTLPTGSVALAPFAAYIARRHLPSPHRDLITVALFVGDTVALTLISPTITALTPAERAPYIAWSVTLLIAASLFGELRRRAEETAEKELQARLERQREEFERAAEEQRAHLAREIHDIVTHSLTVIVAQADGALYASAPDTGARTETKDDALRTIAKVGRDSLKQMRGVVGLLRGSEQRPVTPLVETLDIDQLVATSRAGGLEVDYTVHGQPPADLAPATTLAVQRIIQESLTNALKHGTGTAQLTVDWNEDNVAVRTTNPIPPRGTLPSTGTGLQGMQERASLIDGFVTAAPTETNTWVTEATIPLRRTDAPQEVAQ